MEAFEKRVQDQEEIGEHMRKEASIEQWKTLYEAGTRIKELKLWEKFWDIDIAGKISGCISCLLSRDIIHIIWMRKKYCV